ncbi:MAG: cytochrome c3 family protein [bacterium]
MKKFTVFFAILIPLAWLSTVFGQDSTFVGVSTCQACHAGGPGGNQVPVWQQTAHASAFDSLAFIQKNPVCLQCHTTGWDTTQANNGADDFVTISGDTIIVDNADEFGKRTNVQCESCHGPSSAHVAGAFSQPPVLPPNLDRAKAETCGQCHQDQHHPYIEEWSLSKHAGSIDNASPFLQNKFRNDPNCSGCHTFQGFLQFVGTTPEDTTNVIPNVVPPGTDAAIPITCATCHDPHDPQHEGQLRLQVANLCVKCHNPEDAQPGETVHHATSSMWAGEGAVEYSGFTYRRQSPHQVTEPAASRKCVTCHVFMSPFDPGPPIVPAATGHTFNPRLEACTQSGCHAGEDFPDFDHEGRQTFTDSLIAVLQDVLASASSADSSTQEFAEGLFNLQFVNSSGSRGIHNPYYAEDVLVNTIDFLRGVFTSVEPTPDPLAGMPRKFALLQNFPNPFNPATKISFDVPRTSEVKLVIYNSLGQEVETLVDKRLTPNRYVVDFEAANLSSGIYFYRLISNEFTSTKKMILLQ